MKPTLPLVLALVLALSACALVAPDPTATPRPTRTRVLTPTLIPTRVPSPTPARMGLSSTYDKFKDETTVFTDLLDVRPDFDFVHIEFTYKGNTPTAPDSVFVSLRTFTSTTGIPKYAVDHDFIFLLDGSTRVAAGGGIWDTTRGGEMKEVFAAVFDTAAFAKLATAKKIEAQFGSTELRLTPNHIADLQETARRITP